MANRTVVVDLIVNTAKWTAGFQKASHDMASATTNAETKTRALQQQIGLLGVGMTAFAALAVRSWANFDQAMARTEATGGEAAKRITELTEAAKSDQVTQLGYSAVEASESIYELTKAGVEADAILSGGLSGSLALAAAETMDAAEAATIMASALTQFNLEGEDSAHVADLLTAAAGKAQGSAHDLGFALKQSGLVANQFGLSIEETTGTLALFANAGLIGSDAGTSLRTMLLHLAGPSGVAADRMEEIGFSAYDVNGQFVSMEELASRLQTSFGALNEEQRNQALTQIFGADATRAASLLYREGAGEVANWTEKINQAGYAQEVARKRMDNLNGDLKILSSTWEKFLIGVGEGADAPLRGVVQLITDIVDVAADMPPALQGTILALAGGGGLGVLGVLALGQVMTALNSLQVGLVNTGKISDATATRITNGMKIATLATGALATAATIGFALWATASAEAEAAVDAYVATLNEAAEITDATVAHISEILTQGQDLGWNDFFGNYDIISNAEKMGIAVQDLAGYILGEADAVERVNVAWEEYQGAAFSFGSGERLNDTLQLKTALDNQRGSLEEAKKEKELQTAVNQKLGASESDTAGQVDELGNSIEGTTGSIEDQIEAIQENIDAWQDLANVHLDADEALANYQQAIDDADEAIKAAQTDTEKYSSLLGENRKSLDLNTQAGRDAQEALQGIAKAAHEQVQAQYDANASTQQLTKQMRTARADFIAAAEASGLTRKAAERLADSYGLIPENVETTINARDNATATIQGVKRELGGLFDKTVKITTIKQVINENYSPLSPLKPSKRAEGGPIPLVQGATPGKDSVPIMAMPDEHMLTTADVKAMGGHSAVYAFRRGLHSRNSGLMGFAKGGRIPRGRALKGHSLSYWYEAHRSKLEELQLRTRIGGLRNDLKARGDDALGPFGRRIATEELKIAKKELDEANYADKLGSLADFRRWLRQEAFKERKAEASKQRASERRSAARDTKQSFIRGEIQESLRSGTSGVYSVTDEAQGLIQSGAVTGKSADRLAKAIQRTNQAARTLYGQMDKIDTKLESARDKADELRQIQEGVASSIAGGFGLADVQGTLNPWSGEHGAATGQQYLAAAQSYATKAKVFGQKLSALQKKGFTGVILQEIAMMGVDAGSAAADALLSLSATDVTSFNTAYSEIDKWANFAGEAVTGGFFKGGVAAADGIVKGLESERAKVEAAIERMAKGMQDALKRALGISSPSKVFAGLMTYVGDGTVMGLERQQPRVSAAAADLLDAAAGKYVNSGSFRSTAGSYSVGSAASTVTKMIHVEVTSHNAVAEKDSVIVNRALQSVAAIGE